MMHTEWLTSLPTVISVIVFTGMLLVSYARKHYQIACPVLTETATVTSKKVCVRQIQNGIAGDASAAYGFQGNASADYVVIFCTESGRTIELNLPANEYCAIAEGTQGTLVYQGIKYIAFEIN